MVTVQTKHFIEPSDIIAVRFECLQCRASVSLAITKDLSLDALGLCPVCKTPWITTENSTISPALKDCIQSIKGAAVALDGWKDSMKMAHYPGFTFTLEIKDAPDGLA